MDAKQVPLTDTHGHNAACLVWLQSGGEGPGGDDEDVVEEVLLVDAQQDPRPLPVVYQVRPACLFGCLFVYLFVCLLALGGSCLPNACLHLQIVGQPIASMVGWLVGGRAGG